MAFVDDCTRAIHQKIFHYVQRPIIWYHLNDFGHIEFGAQFRIVIQKIECLSEQ
jgi:hypothetical protein